MKIKELLTEAMTKEQAEQVFAHAGVKNPLKYTTPQLKTLYLALAKKNHPDHGGSVEVMSEINAAFEVLRRIKRGLEGFGWF